MHISSKLWEKIQGNQITFFKMENHAKKITVSEIMIETNFATYEQVEQFLPWHKPSQWIVCCGTTENTNNNLIS